MGGWEGDRGGDLEKSSMKRSKYKQYLVVQELPKNVCNSDTGLSKCTLVPKFRITKRNLPVATTPPHSPHFQSGTLL